MIRRKLSVLLSLLSAMAVLSLGGPWPMPGPEWPPAPTATATPFRSPLITPTARRDLDGLGRKRAQFRHRPAEVRRFAAAAEHRRRRHGSQQPRPVHPGRHPGYDHVSGLRLLRDRHPRVHGADAQRPAQGHLGSRLRPAGNPGQRRGQQAHRPDLPRRQADPGCRRQPGLTPWTTPTTWGRRSGSSAARRCASSTPTSCPPGHYDRTTTSGGRPLPAGGQNPHGRRDGSAGRQRDSTPRTASSSISTAATPPGSATVRPTSVRCPTGRTPPTRSAIPADVPGYARSRRRFGAPTITRTTSAAG